MNHNYTPNAHVVKHSLILIVTIGLIFIWAISPYQTFAVQIGASLLALFVVKFAFREHITPHTDSLFDSVILTALVLTIVSASGGLSSPVFFLIYFLLFILSLLLTPTIPLVISFVLILYFLFSSPISLQSDLLPLLSFPLITPLAVYFGRQHKGKLYSDHTAMHLQESLRRETRDVLMWLSTTFSQNMEDLHSELDKIPNITDLQKPSIKAMQQTLIRLSKMGKRLQEAVEED